MLLETTVREKLPPLSEKLLIRCKHLLAVNATFNNDQVHADHLIEMVVEFLTTPAQPVTNVFKGELTWIFKNQPEYLKARALDQYLQSAPQLF